jgi:putative MATE family efflux protein
VHRIQTKDLTEHSVDGALWRLALPSIGGLVFTMLFNLVDAFFVGRLGPAALAAVSSSAFLYWAIESVAEIPTIGGRALVARRVGAREPERARDECSRTIAVSFLLGAGVLLLGLWTLEAIFVAMRVEASVARLGHDYLGVLFAGAHALLFIRSSEGLLQGTGDARTPMYSHMAALLLNCVLDPILIFGWGPAPEMGVRGAAVATVFCQGLAAAWNLATLARRGLWSPASVVRAKSPRSLWEIIRIGLPVGGMSVAFSLVYVGLTRVVAGYGTAAVAALGLGHRIESVNYLISVGFSHATGALVGQNLGARNMDRLRTTVVRALRLVTAVVLPFAVVMVVWPSWLAERFIQDAATIALASSYIRIAGLAHVGMGWWIVTQGAFGGMGRTLGAMLIVLPAILLRLPVAWFFRSRGQPVEAIWWAISLSAALNGTLLLWWWFKRGPGREG